MNYRPGDAYVVEFTTRNPTTLAAQNADSPPVATANHAGSDDASFVLTVTNLATGRYKVTGTIPAGYSGGDVVNITVVATVASVTDVWPVDVFMIDRSVELPAAPAGYGPGGGSGTTAVTDLAGGSNRTPPLMTVQTPGNQPILGAIVEAYLTSAYTANPATAAVITETTTDVNGHWTLNLPTGAAYTLVVSYPGDQTATGSVTV